VPPGMEGVVIDVKIFSRIEDQVVEKDRGERIGDVRRLEGEEKIRVNEVRDGELIDVLDGQVIALALKAGTVEEAIAAGTKVTSASLREMRLSSIDLKTLRVENKRVNERLRQIIDASTDEKAKIEERAEERIDRILQPDELPPGVIQLVKVYLAEKRKVSVGDKMAGRHGNKGIVARVVPEEDMPFLPDGRPVDIVLNPLGVPSRMNVGQILETHLGWVAKILGFYAKTPVFQGTNEHEIGLLLKMTGVIWGSRALGLRTPIPTVTDNDVRVLLGDVKPDLAEGEKFVRLQEASLNNLGHRSMSQETRDIFHSVRDFLAGAAKELAEREQMAIEQQIAIHNAWVEDESQPANKRAEYKSAVKQLEKRRGMEASDLLSDQELPALAGMLGKKSEADVDAAAMELMRLAGLNSYGKVRLRDGRSGELFVSPVTVGEIYMLKLSHLVDDKIHARSIGPYSLVTQQPLAGKAQFGGQRFGEMEVWALEAYGAAHVLQEILTVKSDDVNGRSRVYEAIVKGQNLPEPGIPESFNVLVKELQALGIKVTMGQSVDGFWGSGGGNGNGTGIEAGTSGNGTGSEE
jgi:DNA-directed RNA polymerase subunit beta